MSFCILFLERKSWRRQKFLFLILHLEYQNRNAGSWGSFCLNFVLLQLHSLSCKYRNKPPQHFHVFLRATCTMTEVSTCNHTHNVNGRDETNQNVELHKHNGDIHTRMPDVQTGSYTWHTQTFKSTLWGFNVEDKTLCYIMRFPHKNVRCTNRVTQVAFADI